MGILETYAALGQKYGNAKSEITAAGPHLTNLKTQIDELLAQVNSLQGQVSTAQAQLVAAVANNATLQSTINQLTADLAVKQQQLDDAALQLADAQAMYTTLEQRIITRYGPLAPLAWPFDGVAWDESHAGTPLDLTGYTETFREDFNDISRIVRKDATTGGPWFAAAHPNFDNDAAFLQPGDYYNPYSIVDGQLNITMVQLSATTTPPLPPNTNKFKSGYIQTRNINGQGGFVQAGGVFEARMMSPINAGPPTHAFNGAWPAFWLLTDDWNIPATQIRMEFDVYEGYSSDPEGFHSSVHYKRPGTLLPGVFPERKTLSNYVSMDKVKNLFKGDGSLLFGANPAGNLFNGVFRTFTVKFGDAVGDPTQVFVDGFEVQRMPTLHWMIASPVFMILNLAKRAESVPTPTAPMPQVAKFDYARALAKV